MEVSVVVFVITAFNREKRWSVLEQMHCGRGATGRDELGVPEP